MIEENEANVLTTDQPLYGYFSAFVNHLVRQLRKRNITSVLVRADTDYYGSRSGTYRDIVPLVENDMADVTALPMAIDGSNVSFTNVIYEEEALLLQSAQQQFGENVDLFLQFLSFLDRKSFIIFVFTFAALAMVSIIVTRKSSKLRIRPWNLVGLFFGQQDMDPGGSKARCLCLSFLIFIFIMTSVGLNCVGTKLVVFQKHVIQDLQSLSEQAEGSLIFVTYSWPLARMKTSSNQLHRKILEKNCGKVACETNLATAVERLLGADQFRTIGDQFTTTLYTWQTCATLRSTSADKAKSRLMPVNVAELSQSVAYAYRPDMEAEHKQLIVHIASKVFEAGFTGRMNQYGVEYDIEFLYSWRTCSLSDQFEDIEQDLRHVVVHDFLLLMQILSIMNYGLLHQAYFTMVEENDANVVTTEQPLYGYFSAFVNHLVRQLRRSVILTRKSSKLRIRPWNLLGLFFGQQDMDPGGSKTRIMCLSFLIFVFILTQIGLNCVGTKLVVFEKHLVNSLKELADQVDGSVMFIRYSWPAARMKRSSNQLERKIFQTNCFNQSCETSLTSLIRQADNVAKLIFIGDQFTTTIYTWGLCASLRDVNVGHGKARLVPIGMPDLSQMFAYSYRPSLEAHLKQLVVDIARKVFEAGFNVEMNRHGVQYDIELLYSWRTCSLSDQFEDIEQDLRHVVIHDFLLLIQLLSFLSVKHGITTTLHLPPLIVLIGTELVNLTIVVFSGGRQQINIRKAKTMATKTATNRTILRCQN
ncbi:hypothetical protein HDE_12712 [Halotydeus destructor]|nr:hypothetical protein HDE_12712 [Halotydeus destructor]